MTVQTLESNRPSNFVRPVFETFFDLRNTDSQTVSSSGPNFGGFFKGTRLFGGHTAAQCFVAAKRLRIDQQPFRIDMNFFAPGTLNHELVYQSTSNNDNSTFMSMDIFQNNILLSNAVLRFYEDTNFIEQPLFHRINQFPANILEPDSYEEVLDLLDNLQLNEWLEKHGQSFNYKGSTNENHIFALRPIDYLHFAGMGEIQKPVQAWARLSPAINDLQIQDPEAILILLSDFIIGKPIFILHDQQRIRVTSSSTLNHKCIFHEFDFDPYGYFFIELELHNADVTALIHGRIFDQKRRLLLTFIQNHYYNLNKEDLHNSKQYSKL